MPDHYMSWGEHDLKLHAAIPAAPSVQYQPLERKIDIYVDFAHQKSPDD